MTPSGITTYSFPHDAAYSVVLSKETRHPSTTFAHVFPAPIYISFKFAHPAKALFPIDETLLGIDSATSDLQ